MDEFTGSNGQVPFTENRLSLSNGLGDAFGVLRGGSKTRTLCCGSLARPSRQAGVGAARSFFEPFSSPTWVVRGVLVVWWVAIALYPAHLLQAGSIQGKRGAVSIDLSKKEMFVPLDVNADVADIRIANIQAHQLPAPYQLAPHDGVVAHGEPVDILLKEPAGVRIRLSLVTREGEPTLRVSPQFVVSGGEITELSSQRIERVARSLGRRVADLRKRLGTLSRTKRRLQNWLIAPGNKPLDVVKSVRARLKIIDQEIKAQQCELPVVQSHCLALQRVADLAAELHRETEIRFVVLVERKKKSR